MAKKNPDAIAGSEIIIRCKTADRLNWRDITPLQGNYKKRTGEDIEKLCNLIKKRGIRFPSYVAKIGGEVFGIDTHGRLLAYEKLEYEGYAIPPVPVVYVEAENKKLAKQLLLECDSRYGKISKEGFENFIAGSRVRSPRVKPPDEYGGSVITASTVPSVGSISKQSPQ